MACKSMKSWSGRRGVEPTTSSLGIQTYVGSKSLARFCREFLNLQHLAESAFCKSVDPNEAQTRHVAKSTNTDLSYDHCLRERVTVQKNEGRTR